MMNSKQSVTIQKMILQDIPRVHELNFLHIPENYTLSFFINHLINHNKYNYVLKIDDKIVGYLLVKMKETAHIVSICLDNDYRKQGYGTELLSAAILDIVEDFDEVKITLNVRISNHTAIRFYQKFGFCIESIVENYYLDNENAFLMSLCVTNK
ncbi:N-alpha-acetyltransferase [Dictyocoela muelleri]|nr:N-alpha-acetyltransferase [Dictyocoela muelleri]